MKAIVYTEYGPPEVLHLVEVAKPVPTNHEILVQVFATTATRGDSRMRSFTVPQGQWLPARLYLGIFGPRRKILGMEIAGKVEAIGRDVTRFQVGDAVMGSTFASNFGGYAEYKCLPEDGVVTTKPANISYEEAAAIPGAGMTALRMLRQGKIQSGQQVMIYGASGAVGTYAVQLAKTFGATVTGVCSGENLALVKALGADAVIDYTKGEFGAGDQRYDTIFDAVGKLAPELAKKLLKDPGMYVDVHKVGGSENRDDLVFLKDRVEAGQLKPVIDRCFTLEQIVEAHRYVDTGHKKGNVGITVMCEGAG